MDAKQIRAEIKAVKMEMRERGIRTVSCFNGGLDDGTYRANAQLFRLKLALNDAIKAEARTFHPWIVPGLFRAGTGTKRGVSTITTKSH